MTRLRHVEPADIAEQYRSAETEDERQEARNALFQIDSGRWENLLNSAHIHMAHADLDSLDHLESMYSDEFLTWVGVYGLVEDLNTFEDVTGVTRE